jgi:glycosyltransferase involved in cell wall biosynthesis
VTFTSPDVSVVICSYSDERWNDLTAAVASVQRQTVLPGEIIVVIDHNAHLLELAQRHMPCVVLIENRTAPGANGSRNLGIAAAKGAIVAFLDDDAIAASEWLEHLLTGFQHPQVLGVGGLAEPLWHQGHGRPRWLPEEFNWVLGCSYRGMPETTTGVRNVFSCNMAIRRVVWSTVGGFRHGIGHVGGQPRGDDETEFCIRVRQQWPEGTLLYEPGAKVYHHVPVRRATWRYFCSRCWLEGRSKALLSRIVGSRDGLASERVYTLRALPKGVARGIADAVLRSDEAGIARAAAIVVGLAITTAGFLAGSMTRGHSSAWAPYIDTLPLESGRCSRPAGDGFGGQRYPAIPDQLYATGLPDPNRWSEAAHPSEEGCFVANAQPPHTAILAQGDETGKPEGPFFPRHQPAAFWPDFCKMSTTGF